MFILVKLVLFQQLQSCQFKKEGGEQREGKVRMGGRGDGGE